MTVIVQDDHLAAGARAACGLLITLTLCLLNENRFFFFFFFFFVFFFLSCSEVLSLYTKNIRFMSVYFLFDGVQVKNNS